MALKHVGQQRRRIVGTLCHAGPQRPLEPNSPRAALLRSVAWLLMAIAPVAFAGGAVALACGATDELARVVIDVGLFAFVAGAMLRLVAAALRPTAVVVPWDEESYR